MGIVSSSSEASSCLDCMKSLISPKSKTKCCKTRPLLSYRISVCSNRSYSADSSSNSTLNVLCFLALEQIPFMIFDDGSHQVIKAGHFCTSPAGESCSGNVEILGTLCTLCIVQWRLHVSPSRGEPGLLSSTPSFPMVPFFLHKEPLHSIVDVSLPRCCLQGQLCQEFFEHHLDKHHQLQWTAAVHGLVTLDAKPFPAALSSSRT